MKKEAFKNFGLRLQKKVKLVYGTDLHCDVNEEYIEIRTNNSAEDHMDPFSEGYGESLFKIIRKQQAYWTFSGDNGTKCECLDEAFELAFKTCKMYKYLKSMGMK